MPQDQDGPPVVLTRAQVAQRFGVSEDTIDRLRVRHGVPVLRLGRLVRFDDRAIGRLCDLTRATPTAGGVVICQMTQPRGVR